MDIRGRVRAAIAERSDELIELCARLVRVPTPNPPGETRAVVPVIVDYLASRGVGARVVASRSDMPCVVVDIEGTRPGPRVVMNGHLDVFPVDPHEAWEFDPFGGVIADGRILGRGAADMKGGVAAELAAACALSDVRDSLAGTLSLCLVSDEEMGATHGTAWLLGAFPELRGDFCLSAEPTGPGLIWFGERGVNDWVITARGQSGPGAAYHLGRNAIERLLSVIPLLHELEGTRGSFPAELGDAWHEAARQVLDDEIGVGSAGVLDGVTLNVGLVEGGTNPAVSPASARMTVNFRVPFGVDPHELHGRLETMLTETQIADVSVRFMHDEPGISPATFTPPTNPMVQIAAANVEAVTGRRPRLGICGGATDMRFYRRYGVPALMYGPRSYPVFAAAPNEYIYVEDLVHTAQVHALTAFDLLSA